MISSKLTATFILVCLLSMACSGETSQSADEGASATIDAQNTRIAELSDGSPDNDITETVAVATTLSPSASATPTPEPITRVVWREEGFSGVYPIAEIGMVVAYRADTDAVLAYSLETGDIVWSIEGKGRLMGADSDYVYTLPFDQRIDAYSFNTGELQWFSTLPESVSLPVQQDGLTEVYSNENLILFPARSNRFLAVSKADGQVNYLNGRQAEVMENVIVVEGGRGYQESEGPIWDIGEHNKLPNCNGTIFINSDADVGTIQAVEVETGNVLWTSQVPGDILEASCSDSAIADSVVYLSTLNFENAIYYFVAINGQTGEVFYTSENVNHAGSKTTPLRGQTNETFAGEATGLSIFTQIGFGLTEARNVLDNSIVWERSDYSLFSVIGGFENIIVGVQTDLSLTGIDSESGDILWEFSYDDEDTLLSELKLVDDVLVSIRVYHNFTRRETSIIDARTGNLYFSYSGGSRIETFGEMGIVTWDRSTISVVSTP